MHVQSWLHGRDAMRFVCCRTVIRAARILLPENIRINPPRGIDFEHAARVVRVSWNQRN